jgi:hypothetical protein
MAYCLFRQLAYVSKATYGIAADHAEAVARHASRRNTVRGITGMFVADQTHFLQYMEGPDLAVERLFRTISRDERHDDIVILYDAGIDRRILPQWNMELIRRTPSNAAALPPNHAQLRLIQRLIDRCEKHSQVPTSMLDHLKGVITTMALAA